MSVKELVHILRRRFWLVMAGALIAGGVALGLSLIWPPSYQAEALVLITKLRPNVTLDPRFQTVAEENIVNLSVQEDQVRRQTLVRLATSPDLIQRVIDRLGDTLAPDERTIAYFQNVTQVKAEGNLIVFTAKHRDPDTAASLANGWATVYREQVNRLYSATLPSEAEVRAQLAAAQATYEAVKEAVEAFLKESRENELIRQIDQKKQLLNDLQNAHLTAARQRMDKLLARLSRIDRLALDAQALKVQLAGGLASDSLTPGEQFALLSVEGSAYAQEEPQPVTLELGEGWPGEMSLTVGQAIDHLDRVMRALRQARASTESEIETLSLALLEGGEILTYGPDGLSQDQILARLAEIGALQAELERQTLLKQDLMNARDIAQETYLLLSRKAEEVQILSELTGVEVQAAASAWPPEEPASPRPLLGTALGILAGGLAGLFLAFALEVWARNE